MDVNFLHSKKVKNEKFKELDQKIRTMTSHRQTAERQNDEATKAPLLHSPNRYRYIGRILSPKSLALRCFLTQTQDPDTMVTLEAWRLRLHAAHGSPRGGVKNAVQKVVPTSGTVGEVRF